MRNIARIPRHQKMTTGLVELKKRCLPRLCLDALLKEHVIFSKMLHTSRNQQRHDLSFQKMTGVSRKVKKYLGTANLQQKLKVVIVELFSVRVSVPVNVVEAVEELFGQLLEAAIFTADLLEFIEETWREVNQRLTRALFVHLNTVMLASLSRIWVCMRFHLLGIAETYAVLKNTVPQAKTSVSYVVSHLKAPQKKYLGSSALCHLRPPQLPTEQTPSVQQSTGGDKNNPILIDDTGVAVTLSGEEMLARKRDFATTSSNPGLPSLFGTATVNKEAEEAGSTSSVALSEEEMQARETDLATTFSIPGLPSLAASLAGAPPCMFLESISVSSPPDGDKGTAIVSDNQTKETGKLSARQKKRMKRNFFHAMILRRKALSKKKTNQFLQNQKSSQQQKKSSATASLPSLVETVKTLDGGGVVDSGKAPCAVQVDATVASLAPPASSEPWNPAESPTSKTDNCPEPRKRCKSKWKPIRVHKGRGKKSCSPLIGGFRLAVVRMNGKKEMIFGGQALPAVIAKEKAALKKKRLEKAAVVKNKLEKSALKKKRRAKTALERKELAKAALEKTELVKAALERKELEKAALEKTELEKAALERKELEKAALERWRREKATRKREKRARAALKKNKLATKLSTPTSTKLSTPSSSKAAPANPLLHNSPVSTKATSAPSQSPSISLSTQPTTSRGPAGFKKPSNPLTPTPVWNSKVSPLIGRAIYPHNPHLASGKGPAAFNKPSLPNSPLTMAASTPVQMLPLLTPIGGPAAFNKPSLPNSPLTMAASTPVQMLPLLTPIGGPAAFANPFLPNSLLAMAQLPLLSMSACLPPNLGPPLGSTPFLAALLGANAALQSALASAHRGPPAGYTGTAPPRFNHTAGSSACVKGKSSSRSSTPAAAGNSTGEKRVDDIDKIFSDLS